MVWFKRIFLFLIVNVLVMTTISIFTSVLGLRGYMTAYGIDYGQRFQYQRWRGHWRLGLDAYQQRQCNRGHLDGFGECRRADRWYQRRYTCGRCW